jgi:hypothetical protein
MEEAAIGRIPSLLKGCPFSGKEMLLRLAPLREDGEAILSDIRQLIEASF